MADLAFLPAVELLRLYRAGKTSPLEVMQAILARIDAVNPKVNAVVTLVREPALAEARRATGALRRGAARGPLFGIPVAIKDVTPTRGIRTTYGSTLFADHVPQEDALVVERLRAAGAIVIGKTNTPEFAFGPNTVNAVFGATRNPWNLALTAGGSSGGSAAALATGMCPLAEGTDLGGSLRGRRVPDVAGADPPLSVDPRVGHLLGGGTDGPHGGRHRPDALGDGGAGRPGAAVLCRRRP
jgi:amidase